MTLIELPFASPSLNEILRWDVFRYKSYRDKVQRLVDIRLWAAGFRCPEPPIKLQVTFRRYSAVELDSDNLAGGCKPIRDCLQRLGVVPNDSNRWLEAHYEQVLVPRGREHRRTEIVIERAAEQPSTQFELQGVRHGR